MVISQKMAICFEQSSMRYCTCGQKSSGIKTLMKKVFRARDPVEAKVLRHQVSDFEEKFSKRIVTSGYSNRPSINLFNPTGYLNSFCQPARNTWLKQQSIPLFNLISCQYRQVESTNFKVDQKAFDVHPENWPGINLLGIRFIKVRSKLKKSTSCQKGFWHFL